MRKFFVFFLLVVLFYIGLHIYIANFFSRVGFSKNNVNRFFLIMALLSVFFLFLRKKFEGDVFEILCFLSFLWMGIVLIWSFFIFIGNLFFYFIGFKKVFVFVNFCTFFISLISIYNAIKPPSIRYLNYYSKIVLRDYKIVFISDLHIDFKFKNRFFSKIVEEIKCEKPDLLIIGGDMLDPGFKIDDEIYKIKDLKIPVVFVFGNHEYFYGIDETLEVIKNLGFKLLREDFFVYGDLNIIGFSDIKIENFSFDDVKKIVTKFYDNRKLNILVSHQPLYFNELAKDYDFIMLSGHTHCGQIFPFHIFTKIVYRHFCGEYFKNNSILYVSRGAGVWGPNMRFLSNNEMVVVNIKKYEKDNTKYSKN